jgi:AcrR family transcriptional regulator
VTNADDPNRAYKEHLVRMLGEMRAEFTDRDLANPTIRRLYQFTEDFKRFVVDGVRTDAESDRLVAELDWMKGNAKIALPAEVLDSMRHILRTEAPSAGARIARLMEAHYACLMGGGDPSQVEREIAAMLADVLLSASDAAKLQGTLRGGDDTGAGARLRRLAAGEDASSVYGSKPWSRRLFG